MSWYVYILQSLKDGKHYIGSTHNVQKRFAKHNSGGVVSTKNRKPFVLIYTESYNSKALALKREKQIKSYKGGDSFKKLVKYA